MKRFCFIFFIFFCSNLIALDSKDNFIEKKSLIDLPVSFFLDNKYFDEIDLNLIFNQTDEIYKNRKKKKKEKMAAILWGFAHAAGSIAQATSGNVQEGVGNFVTNIFSTAAQVAQIDANYTKDNNFEPLKCHLLFNYMISLVEYVYVLISQDASKDVNLTKFPFLMEMSKIAVYAERAAWVANKILENDFVQKFLQEVLDYLQLYLHEKVDDFMNFIRENLLINKPIEVYIEDLRV